MPKLKKSKINLLTLYFNGLVKEEQNKPKVNRRKEIDQRYPKREIRKTTNKIKETKSCFFEMINKIHKHLARLPKEKRQKQLKIRNESGGITIDLAGIKKRIMK